MTQKCNSDNRKMAAKMWQYEWWRKGAVTAKMCKWQQKSDSDSRPVTMTEKCDSDRKIWQWQKNVTVTEKVYNSDNRKVTAKCDSDSRKVIIT